MEVTTAKIEAKMEVSIEEGFLIVRVPLKEPFVPSESGKSLTVATSHGVKETELRIDGEVLNVGVNAYIRDKSYVKPQK